MTVGQIHDCLRRFWNNIPESERANYEAQATPSDRQSNGIKSEPATDSALHDTPPAVRSPVSAADFKEQSQKNFQLQTLLKDAGPEMLETSVEQGVKLLDQLKAPLLSKMANSPDAEQWIQQIDNLIKQAVKTRTVIGVVGNTGVSSLDLHSFIPNQDVSSFNFYLGWKIISNQCHARRGKTCSNQLYESLHCRGHRNQLEC